MCSSDLRKIYEKNKTRRINDKTTPFTDLDYICSSAYGRSRSKGFHHKYFKQLLEENKLPNIRFHDLRHTYATILIVNNYNLKAVSQLLGHASEIITVDVYLDKKKTVINCLEIVETIISKVIEKERDLIFDCSKVVISDIYLSKTIV